MKAGNTVEYWRDGALEDLEAAQSLIGKRHFRHGLFFAHLALEKALKAHVTKITNDHPPRIHLLPALARRGNVQLTPEEIQKLAGFNAYNLEGRYPDKTQLNLDAQIAREEMQWARTFVAKLLQML